MEFLHAPVLFLPRITENALSSDENNILKEPWNSLGRQTGMPFAWSMTRDPFIPQGGERSYVWDRLLCG